MIFLIRDLTPLRIQEIIPTQSAFFRSYYFLIKMFNQECCATAQQNLQVLADSRLIEFLI